MNTHRHRRAHSLDNQVPGCLAKMANLFDLSAGLTSNKLLTDNPHPNGSSLSRSLSDMPVSPNSPLKNQVEDKRTVSQMRRSSSAQKSLGTPMKTLIAEEMSKDVETKHFCSNVVAKLMGLEALPQKQSHLCDQKSEYRTYTNIIHAPTERAAEFWDKECLFLDKEVQNERLKDYTDSHEMLQQSNNLNAEPPPQKGRWGRSKHEKKMALVRQKFMAAKHLVTDEKLRRSKEFQDALEVLSSNRELFLSLLQEPNSLFPGNLCELQSLPRETKRITILRPSKMVDHENFSMPGDKNGKLMMQPPLVAEPTRLDVDNAERVYDCANEDSKDCPPQLTRIVVLKPCSGKNGEMKTSSSPCYGDANRDEKLESSDVTGEIPCKVQENLVSSRRNGTLLSSVYSNGYTCDDSSFYKSDGEAIGNLSDSEVMSPPSRHSWDFINKVGSPYSFSSFSRASYSPESSVCREAKKRLSERWALMASHQTSHEQRHVRKDSSTLGEMLALLDTKKKKSVRLEEGSSGKGQHLIGSPSWSACDANKEESLVDLPKCLMRSKSVPVSSSAYSDNLNVEEVDPQMGKSEAQKEAAKKGNVKPSSFKGKVSSLFSFMSRKSKKEISGKPQPKDKIQSAAVDSPGDLMESKNCDDTSEIGNDNCLGACSSPSQNRSLPEDVHGHRSRGTVANEAGLSDSKSAVPDSKENQDHPSPISVLDPSFDEDDSLTSESSAGEQGPVCPLRFNLIDKSPPIGSIARTLSWDDAIDEAATPDFSKSPNVSPAMEEELDWLAFVQTLLSEAGFDGQLSLDTFISRWYSSECPLDPSLREKFANVNDKGTMMPEAKCRQRRSERKLAYDCVNIALVKVTGCCGSRWCLLDGPYVEARDGARPAILSTILDRVWAQMKEWFSDEVRCVSKDDGDSSSSNSLVVEKVVRNEVVGKGWVGHLAIEVDCLGKDIEMKLLDELVDEAVTDLTGRF